MKATYIRELVITTEEIETIIRGLEKLEEFINSTNELELDLFDNYEIDTISSLRNRAEDNDLFLDDNITIKETE